MLSLFNEYSNVKGDYEMVDFGSFAGFYGPPFPFPVLPEQHHQVYGAGGPHVWMVNRDTSYAGIGMGLLAAPYSNTTGFPGFNTPAGAQGAISPTASLYGNSPGGLYG